MSLRLEELKQYGKEQSQKVNKREETMKRITSQHQEKNREMASRAVKKVFLK